MSYLFQIVVLFLVYCGAFTSILLAALKSACSFDPLFIIRLTITSFLLQGSTMCVEHMRAGEFTIQFFSHGPGTSRSVLWLHLLSLALKVNVLLMPEGGGGLQGFQMTGAQHTSFELKPEEFKPVQILCVILGYSKKKLSIIPRLIGMGHMVYMKFSNFRGFSHRLCLDVMYKFMLLHCICTHPPPPFGR